MHKLGIGQFFAPISARIKVIVVQTLNVFTQGRSQRTFFGGAFAIGKAHGRMRIANVQGPHIGNDVAPRGNFNLDA